MKISINLLLISLLILPFAFAFAQKTDTTLAKQISSGETIVGATKNTPNCIAGLWC